MALEFHRLRGQGGIGRDDFRDGDLPHLRVGTAPHEAARNGRMGVQDTLHFLREDLHARDIDHRLFPPSSPGNRPPASDSAVPAASPIPGPLRASSSDGFLLGLESLMRRSGQGRHLAATVLRCEGAPDYARISRAAEAMRAAIFPTVEKFSRESSAGSIATP